MRKDIYRTNKAKGREKMRAACWLGVIILAAAAHGAVGWKNLDADSQIGGRKASDGYLRGKVVMVYKGGSQMARMEAIWQGFKTKPFVLLGASLRKSVGCTFPQYAEAGLAEGEPLDPIYVVNALGRVIYHGSDERQATEAIVIALTDYESPRSVEQWRQFLEFEFANLPAHAYLRFAAFKKKFPAAAADYNAEVQTLRTVKNVDKVAKLINFARLAKDRAVADPKKKMQEAKFAISVRAAIPKAARLVKDCPDERLAQEAKNALADLKWTAATL